MQRKLNLPAISQAMQVKGFSQASLAEKLGVTRAAVSKWCKGMSFPRPLELIKMGKALGLGYAEMVTVVNPPPEPVISWGSRGASPTKPAAPAKKTKLPGKLPADYGPLLADIKARVQVARLRASLAVNRELILLYWSIGRLILERQHKEGWGAKIVARLAADLRSEFPEMTGLSARNLDYMHAFAEAWSGDAILQQAVAKLETSPPEHLVSLPWGHNLTLLTKLKDREARLWYAAKAVEHGWSRNVLAHQIESGLHQRQGKAVTNFKATLPPSQSDLAQGLTKDPYLFDFLTLRDDANERALETALIAHVEKFLLELGAGFALVGRQVHLEVGGEDFYLDLLFYHLKLRCFVVVDLKARDFTPEAAGKMNFYLSAVDDRFRQDGDQPSIGLILCRSKNRVIAEYALRDMTKPIGVAGYVTKLVDSLPKSLAGAIPSVTEIEEGLTFP